MPEISFHSGGTAPTAFNGSYEAAKYAERRDNIGRLMLSVMVQARGELASKESAAR
jgi:hypothetical protein